MNSKQLNILLADDDIDDCNFFKEALASLPMSTKLTTVNDGESLMNYLFENKERLPHVLFLHINMPRKNDLAVVMFSTSNAQDKINVLFKSGADVYIRKPSSFVQLVQVINHALPIAAENIFSNGKLKYILNA